MSTKQKKIRNFDPNGPAHPSAGIFGLPFNIQESDIVLLPVPWEVTVSYGGGTANGPAAIREASYQVDLYDPLLPNAWHRGIVMLDEDSAVRNKSAELRITAERYISELTVGGGDTEALTSSAAAITEGCEWMIGWVRKRSAELLKAGKLVGLVGGDHSTPLGFMQALAEQYPDFGILQIDAHADLRSAFEGLKYSHASIMTNALSIKQVSRLVQVGIRDYCDEEISAIRSDKRIRTFFDRDIRHAMYRGDSWDRICMRIVNDLPENVYLSFDIDGLDPRLCPGTGTPVAGGFEVEQVMYLLEKVIGSGKRLIGFDLNEVAPSAGSDWDANVAARLLYRLCNLLMASNP